MPEAKVSTFDGSGGADRGNPAWYRCLHRLWVPVFMMAGISVLSGSAGVQTGGWSFTGMDKLAHFIVFGLLGIAWARTGLLRDAGPRKRWLLAAGLTFLFGLLDEWHQYTNPLRTFEWGDLMADTAGALVFTFLYLRTPRVRSLLEREFRCHPRLPSPREEAESSP
ncbi:MAG: VanZ family protein [Oceanipulchritudo sp.]|jgi:hypothetical protein